MRLVALCPSLRSSPVPDIRSLFDASKPSCSGSKDWDADSQQAIMALCDYIKLSNGEYGEMLLPLLFTYLRALPLQFAFLKLRGEKDVTQAAREFATVLVESLLDVAAEAPNVKSDVTSALMSVFVDWLPSAVPSSSPKLGPRASTPASSNAAVQTTNTSKSQETKDAEVSQAVPSRRQQQQQRKGALFTTVCLTGAMHAVSRFGRRADLSLVLR
jgi:hypothetical protein